MTTVEASATLDRASREFRSANRHPNEKTPNPHLHYPDPLDFVLPEALEAREPPDARGLARDEVRLLVSHREDDRIVHARFNELPRFLRPGDLLVVNVSETLPAALKAKREDGTEIGLHLSTQLEGSLWVVEARKTMMAAGERLELPGGGSATFVDPYAGSWRLWTARLNLPEEVLAYLHRWGKPIAYPYVNGEWALEMYQTVYASRPGSAEMPSAGRAFSPRVLKALRANAVGVAPIVLHTGVSSLEKDEPPYAEWCEVPPETVNAIHTAKKAARRVIAVGTTVVRALESATDASGQLIARSGWTELVVTPERGVRFVDGLLTGFHEPKASHLAMLEAIAGREHLRKVYEAALAEHYLWHEFGDLHLIL
jgi:S-adenosylmethionine:tRNA ribosyltransferase-isomerase